MCSLEATMPTRFYYNRGIDMDKSTEKGHGWGWLLVALQLAVLAICMFSTVHLASTTIPAQDLKVMAFFVAACNEFANIVFLEAFISFARSPGQRTAYMLGTWITFGGVALGSFGDTFISLTEQHATETGMVFGIAIRLIPVVVLFILILGRLSDPDSKERMAERAANDLIRSKRIEARFNAAGSIGAELAQADADHFVREQRAQYHAGVYRYAPPSELPQGQPTPKKPERNVPLPAADSGSDFYNFEPAYPPDFIQPLNQNQKGQG
jgi:hypothetical protein